EVKAAATNAGAPHPAGGADEPARDTAESAGANRQETADPELPGPCGKRIERRVRAQLGDDHAQGERADDDRRENGAGPEPRAAAPGNHQDDRRPDEVELLLHRAAPEVEGRRPSR